MASVTAIEAAITFTVDTGDTPVAASVGELGEVENRGTFETHRVRVRDARREQEAASLDRGGFVRVEHESRVASFHDRDELRRVGYPEVERLIAERSGARRVVIFDHTLRTSDEVERQERREREPVRVAHNDYTERSGLTRLRLALPKEADDLARRRFAIIQLWRPITDPVLRDPLAICDATSLRSTDLIATERRHRDRVGEIYNLAYHPDQRWYYLPAQRANEALMFKVFDSDESRTRFTPHTSFRHPETPDDAPPRRSVEFRAFAFF
jgi:hypothetical protein